MSDDSDLIPVSELVHVNPRSPLVGKTVPFVGMEDVSNDSKLLRIRERQTTDLSPGQPSFRDGDTLFAKITPCMENGKGAYIYGLDNKTAFGSTEFHVLRPKPNVSAKFIYHLSRSIHLRLAAEAMMSGSAGQRRVPSEFFNRYKIPIFSEPEQHRIAEILDSSDEQIRSSNNLIAKQKELRIAAIRQLATDGLSLFQGLEASELQKTPDRRTRSWSLVPLGSMLAGIDAGHSPDLEDVPAGPGQWGVLKVSAVGEDGFRFEENKIARYEGLHDSAICVRSGDLLMTRANTSQLVGRSCIVGNTPPGLMLSDKILRLRATGPHSITRYLHIVLGLAEVRRQIEVAATGTSNSMKNISQASVRQLAIPLGRREDIARIVEIDTLHEARIAALRDEIKSLQLLRQGLVHDLLTRRVRVSTLRLDVEGAVRREAVRRDEDLHEVVIEFFRRRKCRTAGAGNTSRSTEAVGTGG